MSCIPSKRVDRIFPVVPPLCLLLAALIGSSRRERVARWSAVTVLAAILFSGSYTLFKVGYGFRKHRDVLVKCGRDFRQRAAERGWNYEVLLDRDEGLVIYFDRPGFLDRGREVQRWNANQLDALVLPEKIHAQILPQLKEANRVIALDLCRSSDTHARYVALVRPGREGTATIH